MHAVIRELREKRASLFAEARGIIEAADLEKRQTTAEEMARFDKLMNEADEIRLDYENRERLMAAESEMAATVGALPAVGSGKATRPEFRSAGLSVLNGSDIPVEWRGRLDAEARHEANWQGMLARSRGERRALQADVDTSGGYMVAPLRLVDQLIKALDDAVYMRQWAVVYTLPDAQSLGAPALTADPADSDWTGEITAISPDTTMAFGRRDLAPKDLSKGIKVSRKLLRMAPNAETIVRDRLAYKFAITQEKAFLTGAGATGPLGVFTASAQGISTSRDYATDNTTSAMTFLGLTGAKYQLKTGYLARARWIFHRDGAKQVSQLTDGNGNFIWRESVRVGEPDNLLGHPVFLSEYAPHTFTAGLYVGILGDFSYYWVVDSTGYNVQVLLEKYADTNEVGFYARGASDGMPVLEDAFVRVTLAP